MTKLFFRLFSASVIPIQTVLSLSSKLLELVRFAVASFTEGFQQTLRACLHSEVKTLLQTEDLVCCVIVYVCCAIVYITGKYLASS